MRLSNRLSHSLAVSALCLFAAAALTAQRGAGAARSAPGSVAISPDSTTIAWTLRNREGSTLHLTTIADPDPAKEKLIAPNGATNCSNDAPVWSPDGNWLAFTSTCTSKEEKPGQEQIFLWSKADGSVKQLTHVKGLFKQAAWSPDGKTIAFLFVENATRSAGALDAMKPWDGVIGEDGVEIQRVYGVRIDTGNGDWLTPANLHVYEFTWAPAKGAASIAFIAAPPPGENTWWVAKLYTEGLGALGTDCLGIVAAKSGCSYNGGVTWVNTVLDPSTVPGSLHGLQIAVPRYSPDGTKIAFIGGLMSDQGSTGGDVWYVPSKGGAPVDVTPKIDGTPCFEAWLSDKEIGFVEDRRGHTWTVDYDVTTRKQLIASDLGEVSIGGGAIKDAVILSKKADYAFVMSGLTKAPEIYTVVGSDNTPKQLTHLNDGAKSPVKTESLEWENEGFHVQGWITYPANYDPSKKYPLIVTVHGGPSASTGPRFGGGQWASQGYFEFQPNPRGSFGQGEAFTMANRKDFGYGDLRDILKGMDAIEAKYPIDKKREGMTGWSYGGFMSMFAATQTNRFAAIVAGAGLSDWLSYYGENSIDQWMIPFFGASVYDDPAVYAKSSAITFIKKAKTPMLIIVGDRDGECPAPQSFEMWHALKDLGVKTQLVVYPNEGHGFRNPEHIRDRNERTVKWFAENMPAK
jgi:dipeptidyl aminopeptidase/acylaminoacyl peptidase